MSHYAELPSHIEAGEDQQLPKSERCFTFNQRKGEDSLSQTDTLPESTQPQRQEAILSPANSMLKILHNSETEDDDHAFAMRRATSSSWQPFFEAGFSPRPPEISTFPFPLCMGESDYVIVDKDVLSSTHEGSNVDTSLEIVSNRADRVNGGSNAESILSSSPDMNDTSASPESFRGMSTFPETLDTGLSQTEEFEQISIPSTSDEETIETEQLSSMIPSFIMPRVSVISLDSSKTSDMGGSPVNIQIVGRGGNILMHRLCTYKKTLGNVAFQLEAKPIPSIILWVVDSANCVLPQVEKRPVVPIWVNGEGKNFPILDICTTQYFVCRPFKMKSLNDDLMTLIDFLSCLGKDNALIDSLLYEGRIGSSIPLKGVNLVLIDGAKETGRKLSNSRLFRGSKTKYSGKNRIRKLKGQKCRQQKLKVRLFVGFSFGIVSIALIMIWKGLGVAQERLDAAELVQMQSPRYKQLPIYVSEMNRALSAKYSRYFYEINSQPLLSWQRYVTDWDNFLYLKLDNLADEFDELSHVVAFRGMQIFQRMKLFVENIMGVLD